MTRTTLYPSENVIAAPITFSGFAPKPGVPASVVARLPAHTMGIPKLHAPISMTVHPAVL